MKSRKILSIILSLAMLIGMIPFSTLSASAGGDDRSFTLNATPVAGEALDITFTGTYAAGNWLALVPAAYVTGDSAVAGIGSAHYGDNWKYPTDNRKLKPAEVGDYGICLIENDASAASYPYIVLGIVTVPSEEEGPAAEPVEVYYVAPGGTGDGRSEDAPAGSITAIHTAINADGWEAGDTVTVKVSGGEELTIWEKDEQLVIYENNVAHAATVIYEGVAENSASKLAQASLVSQYTNMFLTGPSIFRNITICDQRIDYTTYLYTRNYSCTIEEDVKFLRATGSKDASTGVITFKDMIDVTGGRGYTTSTNRNTFGANNEGANVLTINGHKMRDLILGGYGDNASYPCYTNVGEQTIIVNGGTVPTLKFQDSKVKANTYASNLNLVFNDVATIGTPVVSNAIWPEIAGALQVLVNGKSAAFNAEPLLNMTPAKGTYVIDARNENGYALELTDTVGKYKVIGDTPAYANTEDGAVTASEGYITFTKPGNYTIIFSAYVAPVDTYYVQFGAEGDGRSEDAPAPTIDAAIQAINADGWGAGDDVTIVVIDNAKALDPVEVTAARGTPHMMTSFGAPAAFAATITITSPEGTTSHLALSANIGGTDIPVIPGDVIFDNIMIVMCRAYDTSFALAGHNITVTENTKFGMISGGDWGGTGTWNGGISAASFIFNIARASAAGATAEGGTYKFDITNGKNLDLRAGYRETKTYTDDFNIYVENAPSVTVGATQANGFQGTFGKNLNFILGSAVKSLAITGTGSNVHPFAVTGSVQVIGSKELAVNDIAANLALTGKVYVVKTADPSLLDVTATAGTFKVADGKKAFAIAADGLSVTFNPESTITLDAGETTVIFADSFEDLGLADPEAPSGQTFKGWEVSGNKYVAKFEGETVETDEYYVCYGGTGDGRTVENPAADVAAAIASINADGWTTGDDVTVYIMQVEDAVTGCVGAEKLTEAHLTYFQQNGGTLPAYTATLTITSYDYEATGMKYVAYTHLFGQDTRIQLNGPTILKDIGIVHGRADYREVDCNGYDVTFDNAPMFKTGMDQYGSATYGGKLVAANPNVAMGKSYAPNNGIGGTVTIKTALNSSGGSRGIFVPCIVGTNAQTFTNDAALILDNENLSTFVYFGSAAAQTATYEKNLSIVVNNAAKVTFATTAAAGNTVNVGGDLQIIDNAQAISGDIPACVTVTGDTWYIVNANNELGTIALGDTAGSFKVTTEKPVVQAKGDEDLYYAKDGVLTLPAGKYTVNFLDAMPADPVFEYFVQYGADGDGKSEEKPAGSIAAVIDMINADNVKASDEVIINVIDAEDALTYCPDVPGRDQTPHHLLSWTANAAWKPTLVVRTYRADGETIDKATVAHLANSALFGGTGMAMMKGNVRFEDIMLVMTRAYDASFEAGGNAFEVTNTVTFGQMPEFGGAGVWNGTFSDYNFMLKLGGNSASGNAAGAPVNIDLSNGKRLDLRVGWRDAATYTNDVTVTVNGAAGVSFNVGDINQATYDKNLNIKLLSGADLSFTGYDATKCKLVKINGAFQAILPAAAELKGDVTANLAVSNVYVVKTANAADLDFTETAGTFKNNSGKTAFIISDDGLTVTYSKGETISTANGAVPTILFADSFEALALADPEAPAGKVFNGWSDDGTKYTATFVDKEAKLGTYYVQFGAEGDGSTADTPTGDLPALVNAINAEYGEGDLVTIYVIKTGSEPEVWNSADGSVFLQLNGLPNYKATLIFTSYKADEQSMIAFNNAWSATNYGSHLNLMGPTVFKNITIIDDRNDGSTRDIYTQGHNVEFTNVNILFNKKNVFTNWAGSGHFYTGANRNGVGTLGAGSTVIFDKAAYAYDYNYSGYCDSAAQAGAHVTGDQTYIFNGEGTVKYLNFNGNKAGTAIVYDGNVNLVANAAATFASVYSGDTIAPNAVQILLNNGAEITALDLSKVTAKKGAWILKSADTTGNAIALGEEAGSFTVVGGKYAVARGEGATVGKYYSNDEGILIIPAGTYNIDYVDTVDETLVDVVFDGEASAVPYYAGSILAIPTLGNRGIYTFLGWNLNGDTENLIAGGTNYTIPDDASMLSFTSVWEKQEGITVVYVSANGKDTNDGYSAETPLATFGAAVNKLASAPADDVKKIYILGTVNFTGVGHSDMIIVSGEEDENAVLNFDGSLSAAGPWTFEHLAINQTTQYKFFETGAAKPIIIGEGVTTKSGSQGLTYHAGVYDGDGEGEYLVFNSGNIGVYLGAFYNSARRKVAGGYVEVNGGSHGISIGSDGWMESQVGCDFTDDLNIIYNGGSGAVGVMGGNRGPTFGAAVQIIYNNGVSPSNPVIDAAGGYWNMQSADTEGHSLTFTDEAGTFEVRGDYTAIATAEDGSIYLSASGLLTVPAGTYTVTYTDVVYYTNNGEEIVFYQDYTLDLNTARHATKSGELFIGWVDEAGEAAVNNSEFKEGTKLFAKYVKVDTGVDGDFFIKGAQIRTATTDVKQGLRFVVEKANEVDSLLNISEYGSIVLPTTLTGIKELTLGGKYTYNGKEYETAVVPAVNTLQDNTDSIWYTVCITDIAEANYTRKYTVRGYIKWTDLQGNENILYTPAYATNVYDVAKAAAADETLDQATRDYFAGIVTNVDQLVKDAYMNRKKIDVVGNSSDVKNWIYRLGDGGVMVREAEFDFGQGGDPVVIVQASDCHFNYCDEVDFAEQNPTVMSTYQGRQWLKNASSVPNAQKAIEYYEMSNADQLIVTGDAVDYLSHGCMSLIEKVIWEAVPSAIVTTGNHDWVQQMQGTVAESLSWETRQKMVEDLWAPHHDVYYTSKVIKDKVMVIGLENGTGKFWDCQVEPFKADIELARKNGYIIFVFYHIQLATRNPAETDVYPIRRNDSNNTNFYNGSGNVGNVGCSGATATVYDLITNNADVVKGCFCGHWHSDYYTEIIAKNPDGSAAVIPQYILTGTPYDNSHVLRITVK